MIMKQNAIIKRDAAMMQNAIIKRDVAMKPAEGQAGAER